MDLAATDRLILALIRLSLSLRCLAPLLDSLDAAGARLAREQARDAEQMVARLSRDLSFELDLRYLARLRRG